jgi:hypothetical protein
VNIQDFFRVKYPIAAAGRCEIPDARWWETITHECTRTLKYFMNSADIPDLELMACFLTSVCKEMFSYNKSVVGAYTKHYIDNGTFDFDTFEFGSDPDSDHFQFLLFFMDIKSAVYHWIKDQCHLLPTDSVKVVKEEAMKGSKRGSKRKRS